MVPDVSHGLSFLGLMRLIDDDRRFILVREDGIIESFSRKFGQDLGISDKRESMLKIFKICPGFRKVNAAFNQIIAK